MSNGNGKKDRFDLAFDKRFNIETTLPTGTDDRFEQAFNLRMQRRQEESTLDPPDSELDVAPETPLTPDQEFREIVSPEPPKEKPSFFNRIKESFLNAQGALARSKTKPIKKLGTFLRKAAQQQVGPGGMTAENVFGVIATGFGREAAARKVSQTGDLIKKHREGKLEAKDIVDFFRPDKNLKDFFQELKKINREGSIFGVTLDDKKVPQEDQFRSFFTEFNKLAFEDAGLPPDFDVPITPLKFDGPTIKLKTLVNILGISADILDPSIFGVSVIGKVGKIKSIKKAIEAGTELTEQQIKVIKQLDEVTGIATKEKAEAELIEQIEGFGAEPPSGPPLKFEKPGPFERVQADEVKTVEPPRTPETQTTIPKQGETPIQGDVQAKTDIEIREPIAKEVSEKVVEKSEEGLLPFKVTSARKADIAKTREQLGLSELNTPERKSWETSLSNAKSKKLDEKALRLSDEVLENPRAFNDEETAGVVIKASDLKNEHLNLSDELSKLTDEADIKITSAEIQRVEEEFDKVSRALKMSGTEKGRALASQKLTIDSDFSLVSVKTRAKAASGKPLTEEQNKQFGELVSNLNKKVDEMAKLEKKVSQIEANVVLGKTPSQKLRKMTNLQKNEDLAKLTAKAQKLIDEGCTITA